MTTTESPRPKRINVAVNEAELAAIELLIEREGVTLTEAVRRLIAYGEFVYRSAKVDGAEVLIKAGDSTREVVLV